MILGIDANSKLHVSAYWRYEWHKLAVFLLQALVSRITYPVAACHPLRADPGCNIGTLVAPLAEAIATLLARFPLIHPCECTLIVCLALYQLCMHALECKHSLARIFESTVEYLAAHYLILECWTWG